jgi:cation transport ATPase
MRLVDDAQQSKSRTQVLADRAAGGLFYGALGAAVVTAVAWTVAVGFGALEGRGVRATLESPLTADSGGSSTGQHEETVYVGGPNLLRHLDVTPGDDLTSFAEDAGDRGQGVVYLFRDGEAVGSVSLGAGILAPLGFLLSPSVGALLMSASTVIAALNAQLLRRVITV